MTVKTVEKKQRRRQPAAPFITSTLQQEGARKCGFTAQRTMRLAQQLYEAGHITYMRTDSVHLADEAVSDLRGLIEARYGKANVPKTPRVFRTKTKNAQEAHEAIRPTEANQLPDELRSSLDEGQYKLYDLIWKRTVASQMVHATMDTVAVDLACGKKHCFRANGSTITHPGFLSVYQEGTDDAPSVTDEKLLPPMKVGDVVELQAIVTNQHFTEPPPRFSEASLVKTLEDYGIGRPSTYASIISTLQSRGYAEIETKRFHPTDVGRVVNRFLTTYFTQYVDYQFTAKLEDELDAVSRGEKARIPLLELFWDPFKKQIDHIAETVKRKDVTHESIDGTCPECSSPLSIRLGKRGRFIGCTSYPDCKYTTNLDGEKSNGNEPEVVEGRHCPDCESPLHIKQGRYGKFIGCSGYPKCKFIESLEKPKDTNVTCCECHKGTLLQRRSRRGKIFYSCSTYPDCTYAIWNEPINQPCPTCKWPILTIKTTKRYGAQLACPQKDCKFVAPYEVVE